MKFIINKLEITALACIFIISGFTISETKSQQLTQTVRGRVIDKHTLQALPGATVIIIDSDPLMGATTDIDGYFYINNVPVGRLSVSISYVGYRGVYLSNLDHITGRETLLNIEMELQVVTGEEVVISATGDKSQSINPLTSNSARSFTVEETNKFAGTYGDVARMASNYAGVVNNDDAINSLAVRGNSPTGLAWRLEGVDIPSPNHWAFFGISSGPLTIINNNVLANSDFLTGAFPAEYGNATASVFDLKMRTGNNVNHEHLFQVGYSGFEIGSEGPFLKSTNGSYLVNMRYSTMELVDNILDFGTVGVPQYKDLAFKINLPQTGAGSFSVFGMGGLSKIEMLNSLRTGDDLDFYGADGFDLINGSNMGVVGVNHVVGITQNSYLKSTFALTHRQFITDVDSIIPSDLSTFRVYQDNLKENKIFGSISVNSRLSSKNLIKSGFSLSYRHQQLEAQYFDEDYNMLINIFDTDGNSWLVQPYIHWQHRYNNDLTINTGLHYQYFTFNNTSSLEPRLGVRYSFLPNQSVSFGAGRHSQILPEQVYYIEIFDGENYYTPNNNLDMIKSDHLVLGYDISFNGFTRLKFEAYYQKLFDVPVNKEENDNFSMLNFGSNSHVVFPDSMSNDGIGQNIGVELTLERFFHKGFYYLVTASLFDSKSRGSDGVWRNTAFNSNYIGNVLAGYELKIGRSGSKQRYLDLNIKTTYAGGQRYVPFNVYESPESGLFYSEFIYNEAYINRHKDYFRTDFSIGLKSNSKWGTWELIIEATNLFNNENIFNSGFNNQTGEEYFTYQLPRMVIPTFRIRF